MKTEQGIVLEVLADVTKIKVGRHSECSHCGACPSSDNVIVSANNEIGAKVGQTVTFEVKEVNVLMGAFTVFALPLIATFIGVVLGRCIGRYIGSNIEISQIIGGIVAFILSLIFIKLFDKSVTLSKKARPTIVRILQ